MKNVTSLAVAAAVTAALAAGTASAADKAPEAEKCYGVAKAGKNDCKGNGAASCAGHSTKDGQGYLLVPKGTCEKLVGGNTTDPNPGAKQ